MDRVREILKAELSPAEYERLLPILELIERNRKIRSDYHVLKKEGNGRKDIISFLMDKYAVSWATIEWLIYRKKDCLYWRQGR